MFQRSAIAYTEKSVNGGRLMPLFRRFVVEIPDSVSKRLAIASTAQDIATQLAPLEPEANREVLKQVAALLGVESPGEVR
jgi:hypothetical protein